MCTWLPQHATKQRILWHRPLKDNVGVVLAQRRLITAPMTLLEMTNKVCPRAFYQQSDHPPDRRIMTWVKCTKLTMKGVLDPPRGVAVAHVAVDTE